MRELAGAARADGGRSKRRSTISRPARAARNACRGAARRRSPIRRSANRIARSKARSRRWREKVGVLARRSDEIASIAREARKQADATAAAVAELQKTRSAPGAAAISTRCDDRGVGAHRGAGADRQGARGRARPARPARDDRPLRLLVVGQRAATPRSSAARRLRPSSPRPKRLTADADGARAARAVRRDGRAQRGRARARAVGADARARARRPEPRRATAASSIGCRPMPRRIVRVRPIDEVAGRRSGGRRPARSRRGRRRAILPARSPSCRSFRRPRARSRRRGSPRSQARNAAIEASRRFAADALAALGKPSL